MPTLLRLKDIRNAKTFLMIFLSGRLKKFERFLQKDEIMLTTISRPNELERLKSTLTSESMFQNVVGSDHY